MRFVNLYLYLLISIALPLQSQNVARTGKDLAVFFAIAKYQSGQLTNLPSTITDSEQLAQALATHYGFDTLIVRNPTLDQIDHIIHQLKEQYAAGTKDSTGQLLLFFSGHGEIDYFLPTDAKLHQLHRTALNYGIWRPIIDKIPCRHILVAIDACFSVTFDPNERTKGGNPTFRRPQQPTEAELLLLKHKSHKARLFITSDAKRKYVPSRSNFTRKFIEGLNSLKNQADFFSVYQLFSDFIKLAHTPPKFGVFGADVPGSDFLFFPKHSLIGLDVRAYVNREKDIDAYSKIRSYPTVANCQAYLQAFPSGSFRDKVIEQLQQLIELQDWNFACLRDSKKALRQYLDKHPMGPHATEARSRLKEKDHPSTSPTPDELQVAVPLGKQMVYIPGGSFQMRESNQKTIPGKKVVLKGFYMSRYEVSIGEFSAFSPSSHTRIHPKDLSLPVTQIDWYQAIAYCNWRSQKEGLTPVYRIKKTTKSTSNLNQYDKKKWTVHVNWEANGYRLPTEAEWEYAARGGGKPIKWAGTSDQDQLSRYANGHGVTDGFEALAPINSLLPNEVGLYHMSGNAWEWCWDWYGSYALSAEYNPTGPLKGEYRILRGGSCKDEISYLSTTYRGLSDPDYASQLGGIRLVRSSP